MKKARDLDPLSFIMHQDYTQILQYARRCDEVIEAARKMQELDPDNVNVQYHIIDGYYCKGDYQEYINQAQQLVRINGNKADSLKGLAVAYFRLKRKSEGQKILNDLKRRGENTEFDFWGDYLVYGDSNKMLEWLEYEYKNRGAGITMIHNHPNWDDVRSHPRVQEYIRLTGLSQYQVKGN